MFLLCAPVPSRVTNKANRMHIPFRGGRVSGAHEQPPTADAPTCICLQPSRPMCDFAKCGCTVPAATRCPPSSHFFIVI